MRRGFLLSVTPRPPPGGAGAGAGAPVATFYIMAGPGMHVVAMPSPVPVPAPADPSPPPAPTAPPASPPPPPPPAVVAAVDITSSDVVPGSGRGHYTSTCTAMLTLQHLQPGARVAIRLHPGAGAGGGNGSGGNDDTPPAFALPSAPPASWSLVAQLAVGSDGGVEVVDVRSGCSATPFSFGDGPVQVNLTLGVPCGVAHGLSVAHTPPPPPPPPAAPSPTSADPFRPARGRLHAGGLAAPRPAAPPAPVTVAWTVFTSAVAVPDTPTGVQQAKGAKTMLKVRCVSGVILFLW